MWRWLPLLLGLLMATPAAAQGRDLAWQACQAVVTDAAPRLTDCQPVSGRIDPQGRELWLRAPLAQPADERPHALYLVGVASSEAWLNGVKLDSNGRPGASARNEVPGRYQIALPIPASAWRAGENQLTLHLSSHHGSLRLDQPMGALFVAPYPIEPKTALLALTFIAAGALFAAAFGFGVIHGLRHTGSSLILALIAAVAASQAVLESLRTLVPYLYPLHAWRLVGIWALAAAFSVLLVAYVAGRFWPGARRILVGLALLGIAATALAPGFDLKTTLALFIGPLLAAVAAAVGVRRRQPLAIPTLAYLLLFLAIAVAFPEWLVDLSYFLLAAGLVLPLLAAEVVRLGREDQGREAALTAAVARPDCLTVVTARGVERAPLADIVAILGADDYVELRLSDGRSLLHAARLDRLEAELPPKFLRVHRSAIANLDFATALTREGDKGRLSMRIGPPLPVSRPRMAAVRAAIGG